MAALLIVVAAATSHNHPVRDFWWNCDAKRHHCVSHELVKHRGQQTHGFWQSCKRRCTVFPYWRRHIRRVQAAYRQATRAVGNTYRYLTTGYAPGCGASGRTASGIWPYVGVAASTLAFGTRGYVPGYGPFVAEDTGSAVGPGHLDLYFNTCGEAINWGTRFIPVTIY